MIQDELQIQNTECDNCIIGACVWGAGGCAPAHACASACSGGFGRLRTAYGPASARVQPHHKLALPHPPRMCVYNHLRRHRHHDCSAVPGVRLLVSLRHGADAGAHAAMSARGSLRRPAPAPARARAASAAAPRIR